MCYFICFSHLIKIDHHRILYYANNILFMFEYFYKTKKVLAENFSQKLRYTTRILNDHHVKYNMKKLNNKVQHKNIFLF